MDATGSTANSLGALAASQNVFQLGAQVIQQSLERQAEVQQTMPDPTPAVSAGSGGRGLNIDKMV